jgi:hypothetical protein
LSELSRRAHEIAQGDRGGLLGDVEHEIDELACALWGLSTEELGRVYAALVDMQR